jgi:hypothetical protein
MSGQARGILQAVGRRLEDTRDLLDAAMEQATAFERSLRGHEDIVNDLRWDAAKILLDPNSSRSTLRAVQAGAQQLTEQLRHTDRLIGALGAASTDPAHATGVAILSSRAETADHPGRDRQTLGTLRSALHRPSGNSQVCTRCHGLSVRHTVYYTHRTWHGGSRCRDVAMVTM